MESRKGRTMLQTAAAPPVPGQARRGDLTPTLDQLKALVASGVGDATTVPIYREILADLETPVSAFIKIRGSGPAFLLESIEGGVRLARYSFIGSNPLRVLRLEAGDAVVDDGAGNVARTPYTDPLAALADLLAPYQALEVPGLQLPRFVG